MKRTHAIAILILVCSCLPGTSSQAAVIEPGPLQAAMANIPLRELLKFKPREMAAVSGKKPSLKEYIAFTLLKPSMKKAIRKDPGITVADYFASQKKMKTWLKVLLIVAGVFILAFIIFAIAYGAGTE